MRAHKVRVIVSESHEVRVRLPSDFPRGEAELIVVAGAEEQPTREPIARWLDGVLAKLPAGPGLPLEATRRENLYD